MIKKILLLSIILTALFFYYPTNLKAQEADTDGDGLTDTQEQQIYHTDPSKADTDGDGYQDGDEVKNDYSPLVKAKIKLAKVDTDKDGLSDDWEIKLGTDLTDPDTDSDGYQDGVEVNSGYSPLSTDRTLVTKTINVDIKTQTLTYSFASTTLDTFKVSTGTKGYETPPGTYKILKKRPVVHYGGPGYDYPNTKWNLLFLQKKYGYYIHGAYWHNNFGHPMSHGCVNVSYANMERLYNWADSNTIITIK